MIDKMGPTGKGGQFREMQNQEKMSLNFNSFRVTYNRKFHNGQTKIFPINCYSSPHSIEAWDNKLMLFQIIRTYHRLVVSLVPCCKHSHDTLNIFQINMASSVWVKHDFSDVGMYGQGLKGDHVELTCTS